MLAATAVTGQSRVFHSPANAGEDCAIAVGALIFLMEGSRLVGNTGISSLRYSADTNLSPNTAF